MIATQFKKTHTSLLLVLAFALISVGCQSTTTNSNQPLTTSSGTSGSGGSGTSGSAGTTGPAPNAAGLVQSFDPANSYIKGYAYDSANPSVSFFVELWLNGPRGSGTSLGQLQANTARFLFPQGPYGFTFTMPMQYQNGNINQVYAYAIDPGTGARNALGNSPMAFWVGDKAVGKSYYTATVLPQLNNKCQSCHAYDTTYNNVKLSLMTPSKFSGGTATNNEIFNRAMGQNHGGGNICGNASGSPCGALQTWWADEFN